MTDLVTELTTRAHALLPEDRARLAEALLASLDEDRDQDQNDAWDETLLRRIAEVEKGNTSLTPANEVFARIRRNLR